jgi:excisionase family DNA binding protein
MLGNVSRHYVTTGQAAEAIGVGLSTLQRWAHDGLVKPAYRTPGPRGQFRWDIDDLRRQLGMPAAGEPHADTPRDPAES